MAGCFGNHPVDRYLEGQLMAYLLSTEYGEEIYETFSDEFFEQHEDEFLCSDLCMQWVEKCARKEIDIKHAARLIERTYNIHKNIINEKSKKN